MVAAEVFRLNRIHHPARIGRLIRDAVKSLELNLAGRTVLTEAASGAYVVTPLIAAMAGAKVIAVTRDSSYGEAREVMDYTRELARNLGVKNSIQMSDHPAQEFCWKADIITNLGFVRPIDAAFVANCKSGAVVPLMWETWEYRKEDVDLDACRRKGIPVLGTRETDPRLQIFSYVGQLAIKLLLESGVEAVRNRVMVVGAGHFGEEISKALVARDCGVIRLVPREGQIQLTPNTNDFLRACDALVIAEHTDRLCVLGGETGIPIHSISDRAGDLRIIHICGNIDESALRENGFEKYPARSVPPGFMTVATDYVGPKPVIDLHAGGLKVGEEMWNGLKKYGNVDDAVAFALKNSPAMDFEQGKLPQ